jgi:hypothetical protein
MRRAIFESRWLRRANQLESKQMLLPSIDSRLGIASRAAICAFRVVSPHPPVDILKAFRYRREPFGNPFCIFAQLLMRGKSDWSEGERELMGSFVSGLNQCVF